MTEDELRALIGRSRENGFRALFQQYQGYVYSIVWDRIRTVGTKEDAEECVSDVFASVFLQFDSIGQGALQGFIGTLAKRTAIDLFRKRTAKKAAAALPEEEMAQLASEEDIAADCESAELSSALLDAVRSLGEPDATIIIQKFYYDRNTEEIAEAVNLKPTNVRVRLSRALKRLRTLLPDHGISL